MTDFEHAHEEVAPMAPGPSGPLRGLRVIDMTQALAGPFCTMLLADLGADVIKVEPPSGDIARGQGPYIRGDEARRYGGRFASVNRNKRSVVLDLNVDADRERLLALVQTADALVENYRAGILERFDLGYERLRENNRRLVYCAIRGFGDARTGASPYLNWPSYDVVAQSMSGVVSMTGEKDAVMRAGPVIGDIYPATLAAFGVTAAILHARESGDGQFLDVALYDALLTVCESAVYTYSYQGRDWKPSGSRHPQLAPFDIFPTKDGACAIAAPTQKHWERLCDIMGRPDLIHDDRTLTNRERVHNPDYLREQLVAWTTALTTRQVVDALAEEVPVGPVNRASDLFDDPHVAARQMLVAVGRPDDVRPGVFPNTALHFDTTPGAVYRAAPLLGEHTAEVLADLSVGEPWSSS